MNLLRLYNQTATVWSGEQVRDGFGRLTYPAPRQIKVRWEVKQELFMNPSGEQLLSNAIVYVPEKIPTDSYIYLGESVIADPKKVDGAFRVRSSMTSPNLRGTRFIHKLML